MIRNADRVPAFFSRALHLRRSGLLVSAALLCLLPCRVPAQGVEFATDNGAGTALQRMKIEANAATVNAWFLNSTVGVGTATPANLLDVLGKARMEQLSLYTIAQNPVLYFNAVYNGGDKYVASDSAFRMWLDVAGDLLRFQGAVAGAAGGAVTFNEGVVLQPAGNVGIKGTPSASLHVVSGIDTVLATAASGYLILGDVAAENVVFDDNEIMARDNGAVSPLHLQTEGGDVRFHNSAAASAKVVFASNGSLGIGTTAPAAKVQVVGGAIMPAVGNSASAGIQWPSDPGGGTGDAAYIRYYVEAGEDTKLLFGVTNDANDNISFYQAGSQRMTIYNGLVGIGMATPGTLLDVNSTIRARDVFGAGGENVIVGDDAFLTDVDAAGMLGVYSRNGSPPGVRAGLTGTAAIRLGSGGATLVGTSNNAGLLIAGNVIECNSGFNTIRLSQPGGTYLHFNWTGAQFEMWTGLIIRKTFILDHPADPGRYLIHACIEGPESAVFYRGTARLEGGRAEVVLPAYFESLTRTEGRTVLLTPVFDAPDEPVSRLAHSRVEGGRFRVRGIDARNPSQKFAWEVKAVRKDVAPLLVEPLKTDIEVRGEGPYTYCVPAGRGFSLYPE